MAPRLRTRSLQRTPPSTSRTTSSPSIASDSHPANLPPLPPIPPPPPNPIPLRTDTTASGATATLRPSRSALRRIVSSTHVSARQQEKAQLYSKEVERARLKGDWMGDTVAQQANGKTVGWAELLRKYAKHNPDKQATLATVTTEQSLRSSLLAFYRERAYDDLSHEQDEASPKRGSTLFPPSIPAEGSGHGWSGSEYEKTAAQLETYASDTRVDNGKQQGIVAIYSHALFALGRDEEAVGVLHDSHFLETVNTDQVRPEEQSDHYLSALFMMGFVVYGMANERLHYESPTAGYVPFAFAGYARAIELHEELRGGRRAKALPGLPEDEIERWAETALYRNALLSVREGDASLGLNALRAYQAHVARWPKDFRLPQRNVINRTYLRTLNATLEKGSYAPPPAAPGKSRDDWRSQAYQRAVVAAVAARVYIRDFESERAGKSGLTRRTETTGYGIKTLASRTVSTRRPFAARALGAPSSLWANELQTVSKVAAANVLRSSEFPRAGKVNVSALLLADELFRAWQYNGEMGGEHSDELVESLYMLSRLTFHSQRISRHLFTVLTASQAYAEARCALELYVSIVEKAREGDAAGSAALVEESKIREKKQDEEGYDLEEVKKKEKDEKSPEDKTKSNKDRGGVSDKAKKAAEQVSLDADDDETFVTTLLTGAHVLYKYLGDVAAAHAMTKKALGLLPSDRVTQSKAVAKPEYLARAKRIAGETRAAWALRSVPPEQLPAVQREAIALLEDSLRLDSQSSEGWFSLAYLQAQMGEIKAAIGSVRKAIELEPADVRSWHLLVLLVSATKDFDAAFKLAEVALDEAEEDDEADGVRQNSSGPLINGNGKANGQTSTNTSTTTTTSTFASRTRLLSVDFPPTTLERAEAVLQLMATQNALEELISGSEVAIGSQKDLFLFFHDRIAFHVEASPATRGGLENGAAPVAAPHGHGLSRLLHLGGGRKGVGGGAGSGLGQSGAVGGVVEKENGSSSSTSLAGRLGKTHLDGQGVVAVDGAIDPKQSPGNVSSFQAGSPSPLATAGTPAEARRAYQFHREVSLLSDLWLLSAASFRRSAQAGQARIAIQEAERLDAGRPQVWTQLALLSESIGEVALAVESLHKALACEKEYVPANVHLARIYLTKEEQLTSTPTAGAAGAGQVLSRDATRSRSVGNEPPHVDSATPTTTTTSTSSKGINDNVLNGSHPSGAGGTSTSTAGEVLDSPTTKSSARLALAEGLLLSTTSHPTPLPSSSSTTTTSSTGSTTTSGSGTGSGNDTPAGPSTPEAWLYLAHVYQRTHRRQRARECLRFALRLEERRSIRPLEVLGR